MLIVNNKNITFDPKSGVPLPTSYFDPGTKKSIYTLKSEFISFIVIDVLSSFSEDQDFKSKLINSLIVEGKWAKHGMNHNLIIPLFLNSNFTDPNLIAFSGFIHDSEIYIGQAVRQAMSLTVWKYFWLINKKFYVFYEQIKKIFTQNFVYCRGDFIIPFCSMFRASILHLCQIFSQYPITGNDIRLMNIVVNYITHLADIIHYLELKSSYLSDFVTHTTNLNQYDYKRQNDNQLNFYEYIDTCLTWIPTCLTNLPSFYLLNNSSSWIINQLLDAIVDLNLNLFRLYLDDCDFDLNSKLNTTYQMDADSCKFSKTAINLVECFCSDNVKFGKRVPLPYTLFGFSELLFHNIFSLCSIKKFTYLAMVFLKLTINQIMYCPENILIPVWPSAVSKKGNKLIYNNLYSVLVLFQQILKQNNSELIHNYIIELVYQTVCPLVDCKVTNLSDIHPHHESLNAWVDLKQSFDALPRPKHFVSNFSDYIINLSMTEILDKRWADINIKSSHIKEKYLHVLYDITKYVSSESLLSSNHRITSASLGLQRLNNKLTSEPRVFISPNTYGEIYTDDIRSALHFQFAMLFLTPEALSRHFEELQMNAWRCHPLYSPNRYSFRPPHCAFPERQDDVESGNKLAGSAMNISAAGQNSENSSNPSPLFSAMGLEERRLPTGLGPLDIKLSDINEKSGNVNDATQSSAQSFITLDSASLVAEAEPKFSTEEQVRDRLKLAFDPELELRDNQQRREHEPYRAEGNNDRVISLDSPGDEHEGIGAEGNNDKA